MTAEGELVNAIRQRIADPQTRIDLRTAGDPPQFDVATVAALDLAETELGFALPPLLRRLFSEVENGGFGPGAGLLGVKGGHMDLDGRTLGPSYVALRAQGWREGLLPLCDLGGGAWSCVDRRSAGDSILIVDATGIARTRFTLFSWLHAWASGVDIEVEMFEIRSGTIVNPFTGKAQSVKQRGHAKGELLESW